MPRKPNYKFERMERQKAKAAKKAARLEAKVEKTETRKLGEDGELAGEGSQPAKKQSVWPGEEAPEE